MGQRSKKLQTEYKHRGKKSLENNKKRRKHFQWYTSSLIINNREDTIPEKLNVRKEVREANTGIVWTPHQNGLREPTKKGLGSQDDGKEQNRKTMQVLEHIYY